MIVGIIRSYSVWQLALSVIKISIKVLIQMYSNQQNDIKNMLNNMILRITSHKQRWIKQVKKNNYIYPFQIN